MFRRGLLLLLPILITLTIFVNSRAESSPQSTAFPILVTVQESANLREGPGTDFAITGSAKPGQVFYATGCNEDCSWYQLGPNCWIAAFLVAPYLPISPLIPTINVQIPITITATLTDTFLIVLEESTPSPLSVIGLTTQCPQTREETTTYAGPSTFYAVVDTRPAGECVAIIGRNLLGDWFQLSHGMWLPAAVIIFAEPIETIPVTEFTPSPTVTPTPTLTPTPTPTNTLPPGLQPITTTLQITLVVPVAGVTPTPQIQVVVPLATPTPTPQTLESVPGPEKGCDPNYSGTCVPPYPPYVTCDSLPANFFSIGSDPHGLDPDKDGIACENP